MNINMNDTSPFESLASLRNVDDSQDVVRLVDDILSAAINAGASDVHFQPTSEALQIRWRIDGVMQPFGQVPPTIASNVIVRLKVLARLLTYQTKLPQEGRITGIQAETEIRISCFPTVFGEKVVARILNHNESRHCQVSELGLPQEIAGSLVEALSRSDGMILIVGPAGSGKTTTAYACLREILSRSSGQRNIVSMEDPVEVVLDGVAQSEVSESAGLNLTNGLRSLVRQDPDVIFVGEIRDPETASIAFQAAMTGQLVITTFHASDAATAISRLLDMAIPSYVLRSATNLIVAQRLLRKLCDCATSSIDVATFSKNGKHPQGCPRCQMSGYRSRQVVAEMLALLDSPVSAAIENGIDAQKLRAMAQGEGMNTIYSQAQQLVTEGITSPAELIRVFGLTA
jgi:general secretion pathway protein E